MVLFRFVGGKAILKGYMLTTVLSVLAIAQIGIMSPGSDCFIVIRNSVRYPRAQALATSFGVVSGVLFHSTLCTLGLATLVVASPSALKILTYVGALYLFYIGVQAIRSNGTGYIEEVGGGKVAVTWSRAFREGFFCNVTNMKVSLFFLGVFSQLIPIQSTMPERAIYGVILLVHALIYWTALTILIQKARLDIFIIRWGHVVDKVFGIALILLSLRLVVF